MSIASAAKQRRRRCRRKAPRRHSSSADLASEDGPAGLTGTAPQTFGPFSILVHSASPRRLEADNVLTVSDAVFDQMLAVNLKAGFVLAREIARTMLERKIKRAICLSLP